MSYGWANNLLYRMTGNRLPPPQDRPQLRALRNAVPIQASAERQAPHFDNLENLFARAAQQVPGWTTISVRLPNTPQDTLTFSIDQGNGGRPDLRSQLTLDTATGADRSVGTLLQLQPRSAVARLGSLHSHRRGFWAAGTDYRRHRLRALPCWYYRAGSACDTCRGTRRDFSACACEERCF